MKRQGTERVGSRTPRRGDEHPRFDWIKRLCSGQWAAENPEVSAFLLACAVCWLAVLILSAIRIRDYTAGIWPLFN